MRMDNYPDDIRQYDHVPGSPFYEDPSDGLDELDDEELSSRISQAESCAEDPDVSRKARHACEASLRAMYFERDSRQSLIQEEEGEDE